MFTDVHDGDLGLDSVDVELRRATIEASPWTWRRQVHGRDVAIVSAPGEHAGSTGDGSATAVSGAALSALGADCAPVLFWSPDGVVGAAHVGWRGAVAGVVAATADAMRALGATDLRAIVGPCVHPGAYEFGERELSRVADRLGETVRSTTVNGTPALDMPATVRAALAEAGVQLDHDVDVCTSSAQWWSHRTRGDTSRHGGVIVIEGADR